ncbi:hypothetical protein [Planctobacterium marinum]|uniref:Uncharacterized protein n=1 Tax=Planctobacterium marinum TaxID=1631968 RepID=A0AA48KTR4_9ALTE|nr:hypothetical protein MACH26_39830 [Planctobacterium marinum]
MKLYGLLFTVFLSLTGFALSAQEMPDVDYLQDTLDYCVEYYEGEEVTDKAILDCINEELDASGYAAFPSLQAVKDFIAQGKEG